VLASVRAAPDAAEFEGTAGGRDRGLTALAELLERGGYRHPAQLLWHMRVLLAPRAGHAGAAKAWEVLKLAARQEFGGEQARAPPRPLCCWREAGAPREAPGTLTAAAALLWAQKLRPPPLSY